MSIVLSVRVDTYSLRESLNKATGFLLGNTRHTIFTPNPEMLVKAHRDIYFKNILNTGDLNLCDGRGLQWALRQKYKITVERIPGVDFMIQLCRLAEENGKKVFLLGSGNDEIVKKTAENLRKQFPNLQIVGYDKGPTIVEKFEAQNLKSETDFQSPVSNSSSLEIDQIENGQLLNKINDAKPDILFVAFGMGKQEKWIYENLKTMSSITLAMGVGGSFDYIAGNVKRAPCWMRKVGLEWLYRLLQQPRRLPRVLNATLRFLFIHLFAI